MMGEKKLSKPKAAQCGVPPGFPCRAPFWIESRVRRWDPRDGEVPLVAGMRVSMPLRRLAPILLLPLLLLRLAPVPRLSPGPLLAQWLLPPVRVSSRDVVVVEWPALGFHLRDAARRRQLRLHHHRARRGVVERGDVGGYTAAAQTDVSRCLAVYRGVCVVDGAVGNSLSDLL